MGIIAIGVAASVGCSRDSSSDTSSSQSAWISDLASVSARQTNHGFPRLANDTQTSFGGNLSNGFLGKNLFSRLHWYDLLIIDGNNSMTTSYTSLTSFQGYQGSIRALNPNSVQLAYFSIADFSNYAAGICYQPLLTYYAFGTGFSVFSPSCTDLGTNDFNSSWLYHDSSGNPLNLYNFGAYYSHIPQPSQTSWQQRYISSVQNMIISNSNIDGLYQDWGGFTTIPSLGLYTTVSLNNNGVDNLGGVGNLANITHPVNVDWQNGLLTLYAKEKGIFPANFILAGNSGWGGYSILKSYTDSLHGTQVEDFLNSVASPSGWQGAMYTYATWSMNAMAPNFALIQANINFTPGASAKDANHMLYDLMFSTGNNWLTTSQYAQLRFALASTLMFDGYFASSNTNATAGGYSAAYWLDEFAVDVSGTAVVPADAIATSARAAKGWLGTPLALAYNVAATSQTLWSALATSPSNNSNTFVWRRDFKNGIVIVNPTGSTVSGISLGGTFKKISGVIDPTFNNGATGLTSISLPAQSGVVLHR